MDEHTDLNIRELLRFMKGAEEKARVNHIVIIEHFFFFLEKKKTQIENQGRINQRFLEKRKEQCR